MNNANRHVVEANIPAADPFTRANLGHAMSVKQKREQEDITAWLEMQDDAELELLTMEFASKHHRSYRQDQYN